MSKDIEESPRGGAEGPRYREVTGARPRPPAAAFYSMLVLLVASNEPQ